MTRLLAILLTCLTLPAAVAAQTPGPTTPREPPRVVLDAGAVWIGGGGAGSAEATYTRADGTAYPLFTMTRRQSGGMGVGGHLLVRVTSRWWVEAHGSVTAPALRVELSRDGEAADATAGQTVTQFLAGGGVLYGFRPGRTVQPFARVAVSWLRHLSDDQTLYMDGAAGDLGGGVQYVWRPTPGHFKGYGLRLDAWLSVRDGGLVLARRQRLASPAAALTLMVKF